MMMKTMMKMMLAFLTCFALLCCGMAALAEEEIGMQVAASMEEAAEIYAGEIPSLAVPEGFALQEVVVDDFGLTAYYASDAASFEFSVYDYGDMEGIARYMLKDGAISALSAAVVDLYEEDGQITSADVYSAKGAIYFYFENMDQAAVEAVLKGLEA